MDAKQLIVLTERFEQLKNITRTSVTSDGRRESVAEHSWRLCMMCLLLREEIPDVDFERLLLLCLVHDMGEAYDGDIPAKLETDRSQKLAREMKSLQRLLEGSDHHLQGWMLSLWHEYNEGITREARLVKALDKIETIIQHNQGADNPDIDFAFNVSYGSKLPIDDEILQAVRSIIDETSKEHAKEQTRLGECGNDKV